jgi:hypothetical protein
MNLTYPAKKTGKRKTLLLSWLALKSCKKQLVFSCCHEHCLYIRKPTNPKNIHSQTLAAFCSIREQSGDGDGYFMV